MDAYVTNFLSKCRLASFNSEHSQKSPNTLMTSPPCDKLYKLKNTHASDLTAPAVSHKESNAE